MPTNGSLNRNLHGLGRRRPRFVHRLRARHAAARQSGQRWSPASFRAIPRSKAPGRRLRRSAPPGYGLYRELIEKEKPCCRTSGSISSRSPRRTTRILKSPKRRSRPSSMVCTTDHGSTLLRPSNLLEIAIRPGRGVRRAAQLHWLSARAAAAANDPRRRTRRDQRRAGRLYSRLAPLALRPAGSRSRPPGAPIPARAASLAVSATSPPTLTTWAAT